MDEASQPHEAEKDYQGHKGSHNKASNPLNT